MMMEKDDDGAVEGIIVQKLRDNNTYYSDYCVKKKRASKKQEMKDYERLEEIRRGAFGAVYRARNKRTNEIVAVKAPFHVGTNASMMREIDILRSLRGHPNIVDFKEAMVAPDGRIYIMMEYAENDLHGCIYTAAADHSLSAATIKSMMRQLLVGVKFLHDNRVMHRDLKPSNILLNSKGVLKICDFGMSRRMKYSARDSHLVGTGSYRAPELQMGEEAYSEAVDMWAVGCIMAEMLLRLGGDAEPGELLQTIFWIVGSGEEGCKLLRRDFFPATVVTGAGFDLLMRLLSWEPINRITAESALAHRWFEEEEEERIN